MKDGIRKSILTSQTGLQAQSENDRNDYLYRVCYAKESVAKAS